MPPEHTANSEIDGPEHKADGAGAPRRESRAAAAGTPAGSRSARLVEMVALFVLAPACLSVVVQGWMVFPAIWALGLLSVAMLRADASFDRARFGGVGALRMEWKGIARRGVLVGCALAAALAVYDPGMLLEFPRRAPLWWGIVMVGYPVLSVYAQEVAFRTMFFHRYAVAVGRGWGMIIASAIAFGLAHVILHNWVSVAFSTIGGVLLARTYQRTRSTLVVAVEHAIYGCLAFTIGWGAYFYGGSAKSLGDQSMGDDGQSANKVQASSSSVMTR